MRKNQRGVAVAECAISLCLVTILVTAAMDGIGLQAKSEVFAKDALAVRLAASSRLESASERPPAPGRRAFDAAIPGATGEEDVREVAPGLLEVVVRVRAASGVRTEMTTRVAVEGRKP
jgi:hypothetical protein